MMDDLPGQLERALRRFEHAHAQARALAHRHEYAAAARVLEEIPAHLRDEALYAGVKQKRDRLAELERAVREAVGAGRLAEVRPLVEEYLALAPGHVEMRRLLAALPAP
jgi:hypothetical protein